jgi:hypothetical protein
MQAGHIGASRPSLEPDIALDWPGDLGAYAKTTGMTVKSSNVNPGEPFLKKGLARTRHWAFSGAL